MFSAALSASVVRGGLTPRAIPVSMCWVPDQHSQGLRYEKTTKETTKETTERLKCLAGPSPDLQPLDVVQTMLSAFQRGYGTQLSK